MQSKVQRTKLSRNYVVELDDGSNNDIKTSMYHFKLHRLKKIIQCKRKLTQTP